MMAENRHFQHIGLISRASKDCVDTLQTVADYLQQQAVALSIETLTAQMMQNHSLATFSENTIPAVIDLMLAVGGDGSLLHAARCAHTHKLPVLGVNRGRLGFLTDIRPTDLSAIGEVLQGHYDAEERFLLSTAQGVALNDIVLLPSSPQLIDFDVHVNQQLLCHHRADGLIIATPTGSTAYALSGGGPILHPKLNAIALVPMFSHTLSNRPIVIDGNASIQIHISGNNLIKPTLSCDGSMQTPIDIGSVIEIKQHATPLQLIHPKQYDYFATLREKLGWQRN